MSNLRKIIYAQILEQKLEQLEKEVQKTKKEIMENYCTNEHICVRTYGTYKSVHGFESRCLFCGKPMGEPTRLYVDTAHYMTDIYDENIPNQKEEKFRAIQSIAFDMIKENPDISNEELVTRLNDYMDKEMEEKNSKKSIVKGK